MFLTRFDINPVRRGAHKLLGSPQAMHAAVLASFPSADPGADPTSRVLWRVDTSRARTQLYIQSPTRPDLTHLVEQAGWPTTATWSTGDVGALLDSLDKGHQWAFRLTANPTFATKVKEGGRSQRVAHVTAEQQLTWLSGRAGKWGFRILDTGGAPAVDITHRSTRTFRRQQATVTLVTATFDGLLEVEDPEVMREAIIAGLGPAKGYGCGLLTLARTPTR